ncbi:MAG: nitroreductase [Candidatus Electrothrix sp. AR3]|nr:nitroreductase [Candidatus Electrothrix sp. AR3]
MELKELVRKNRSYRRFQQEVPIRLETLKQLVDLARLSASAANKQALKYILIADPQKNAQVFPCLGWAGYLPDWPGPAKGERPAAYIVILEDTNIGQAADCDHGIAAQSILLGATEQGLGGCMMGSIQKEKLSQVLAIPTFCKILLVLALGKPKEQIEIEAIGPEGAIKYWRCSDNIHHVPKRSLQEIIINQKEEY